MIGHVTKIWNNVVEATFKKEELPKVDFILTLHNNTCVLLVKRIIDDTSVRAIVIYQKQSIKIGDQIVNTNDTLKVPVGQAAKNNIYDISGAPMLQQRAKGIKYIQMNSTIKKEKKIYSKHEILETGIKAIDFFMPILKGHNLGILGGAGVGKTVLMKEIIFNSSRSNSAKKNSSIFIGSGERSREGVELFQELEQSNLMKDSMMFISKMDEPPGARMSIVPYGVTAAEYLRDVEKEDVLLFIDNIFRFIQAGNEVAPALNKKPITGGYQATLDTEVSNVEDRLYATEDGSITSFQTLFLPMDDLADPSAVSIFSNLDGSLVLSREQTSKNIFPAFDPLASSSSSVSPDIIGQRHYNAIIEVKSILQKYRDLEDVILILGIDELDKENKIIVKKALQLQNFFTQNFFVAEAYTKAKGVYVTLEETLESVIRIVEGKYINQSPEIFSFIGSNLDLPTDEELNLNKVDL